jgi:hypothetical protein
MVDSASVTRVAEIVEGMFGRLARVWAEILSTLTPIKVS